MKAIPPFVSDSVRRLWRGSGPLMRGAACALILAALALLPGATAAAQPVTPEAVLRAALRGARQAGSYQVDIDIQQTISPEQTGSLAAGLPQGEPAHFLVTGHVGGPQKARFAITPRRIGIGLQSSMPAIPQEILISGGELYERTGDRWVRNNDVTPLPGVNADALSLLAVARDVRQIEPEERLTGRYERVTFALHSSDVLRHLLSQQGQVDEFALALAEAQGLRYEGSGELWVDEEGLPARMVLNLELNRPGEEGYRTVSVSTADYSSFGARLAPDLFDPTIAPVTRGSTSPVPGSGMTAAQLSQWAIFVVALIVTLALCWLLISGRSRAKTALVSLALVIALACPYAADAAGAIAPPAGEEGQPAASTTPDSEVVQMLQEARAIASRHRSAASNPASNPLVDIDDEDQDGLPNGYELRLGTNPFIADTDMDGLTDYREVVGYPCDEDPEIEAVETNPLLPDSNGDGLRDGDEFFQGQCRPIGYSTSPDSWGEPIVSGPPYAWRDDNDGDFVPDGLDLSPFSAS
ncbi:MAG: hypothetical protein PVI07_19360, partial [Anaerolineae bacterium]